MFNRGDWVVRRSEPTRGGMIADGPKQGVNGVNYQVFFNAQDKPWIPEVELMPEPVIELDWVSHPQFLRDLAVLKLSESFTDVIYSMGASRTKFLVYQFQPVLKFIQSLPHGMLVADEVGLGKTIEAGLILKEMIARGSVRRVLVVCPANLRAKWHDEMQQRFGLEFRFINAADLRGIRQSVITHGWPDLLGIASLEGLRRPELKEILEETSLQFDLVIIDEAHHLRNQATQSFDLGDILSDQSDHLLLLSATPVQTGTDDLVSLLKLIEPAEFGSMAGDALDHLLEPNRFINGALQELGKKPPDQARVKSLLERLLETSMSTAFRENPLFDACIKRLSEDRMLTPADSAQLRRDLQELHTLARYFTRTRKREVEELARRRSLVVHVPLTEPERHFYSAWVKYITARLALTSPGAPAAWATSMRERQAASSLHCAREALQAMLAGDPVGDVETTDPELEPDDRPAVATATDALVEQRRAVIQAAEALETDSKYERLESVLRDLFQAKPARKVLLFVFFKGTLRYIERRLRQSGFECFAISGDDKPEARGEIVAQFKDDRLARILLSTEVGAEGLDFQFCDAVINYDLPWNPMRVEQRIGRIDRFGQASPYINVVSFFVDGTIDTTILQRLYERISVFEEAIGELEPILGPLVREIERSTFSPDLTPEDRLRRAEDAIARFENLRLQNAQFVQARAHLLGQGQLIREDIESIRRSGRYLSPEEMAALVREWLDTTDSSRDSLDGTDRTGVFDLRLSPPASGRIDNWMVQRRVDPAVSSLLRRIHNDHHAWITFDNDVAHATPNLPFVDTAHPLIRVALEDSIGSVSAHAFNRACALMVSDCGNQPFLLYIYRLRLSGAEPRIEIVPIAVQIATGEVLESGEDAFGRIATACKGSIPGDLTLERVEELEAVAFRAADSRRVSLLGYMTDMQAARLATRRATISRSYDVRMARAQDLARRVNDPRIKRLHEGHYRTLEAARAAKLQEIDSISEPGAGLDLMAVCLVSNQT